MTKLIRYVYDVLVCLLMAGTLYILFLANSNGPGETSINGPIDLSAAAAFAILVLFSLMLGLKAKFGLWDTDPESERLRHIYQIPILNVAVAYWRLRTGRGITMRKPPKQFPWQEIVRDHDAESGSRK